MQLALWPRLYAAADSVKHDDELELQVQLELDEQTHEIISSTPGVSSLWITSKSSSITVTVISFIAINSMLMMRIASLAQHYVPPNLRSAIS